MYCTDNTKNGILIGAVISAWVDPASGVATNFFPGGAKFGDLGTEFPQWGPGAKPPKANDCIIIMCRILTTR